MGVGGSSPPGSSDDSSGPDTTVEISCDNTRPSAVQTAPVSSHGCHAASDTVRVRLDLDLPHDLPVLAAHRAFLCAARGLAVHRAHRRHFAALDFHAARAHVFDRVAESHPDLDRLRTVVLIRRRREPRP